MHTVLILNYGGHEVIGRTSAKHARLMLHRGVATAHTWLDKDAFNGVGTLRSIELGRYVFAKWLYDDNRRSKVFSKKGVLKRDNYHCAYCPNKATTIDHIHPRSKGGESSWMNCVASCSECNTKKRDMTMEEAGMELLSPPFIPA